MPVTPDTQFPYTQVINFTNFSLSQIHVFPFFQNKWWPPPHYSAPCFSHLIYLGDYILINTLQEWPLVTSYGQNSPNVSYLYKTT